MKGKFTLKPCPHCGGEATLASPDQWSYLSCIVFCPSCLAKGPQRGIRGTVTLTSLSSGDSDFNFTGSTETGAFNIRNARRLLG